MPGDRTIPGGNPRPAGDSDVEGTGDGVGEVVVGEAGSQTDGGIASPRGRLDPIPVRRCGVCGTVQAARDPLEAAAVAARYRPLRDRPASAACPGVTVSTVTSLELYVCR